MTEYVTVWVDDLPDLKRGEEIVRCRDCKHYMDYEHEYEPNLGYCRKHDREEVRDSWFCAWAERKVDA